MPRRPSTTSVSRRGALVHADEAMASKTRQLKLGGGSLRGQQVEPALGGHTLARELVVRGEASGVRRLGGVAAGVNFLHVASIEACYSRLDAAKGSRGTPTPVYGPLP